MHLQRCIPPKRILVTICGPTGSGKSQLANATAAVLGNNYASRVPTDYFLIPRRPDQSIGEFHAAPLAWDWALLHQRLDMRTGSATSTPDMDFETFHRRSDVEGIPFIIRDVMICDAMAPVPGADIVVRIDVPDEERRRRLRERDARWGTRVHDRQDRLDSTWNAVSDVHPDVVIDGTESLEQNAVHLAGAIHGANGNL